MTVAGLRDQRGQVAVWVALFIGVLVAGFAFVGVAQDYSARATLQTAADAATMAAAETATPVLTLDVTHHDRTWSVAPCQPGYACTWVEGGRGPDAVTTLNDLMTSLLPSGWVSAAGCNARDAGAGGQTPPQAASNGATWTWRVCTGWVRTGRPTWTYTDQGSGSAYSPAALSAAHDLLAQNLTANFGSAAPYRILSFTTTQDSGEANIVARVDEPGNAAQPVVGSLVYAVVHSSAAPRLTGVPRSGS